MKETGRFLPFVMTKETFQGMMYYFECQRCNLCEKVITCVRVTPDDILRISNHLNITIADFHSKYMMNETHMPSPCPFFDGEGCTIHAVRPLVCVQFPFNQTIKIKGRDYMTVSMECPAGKIIGEKFGITLDKVKQ